MIDIKSEIAREQTETPAPAAESTNNNEDGE